MRLEKTVAIAVCFLKRIGPSSIPMRFLYEWITVRDTEYRKSELISYMGWSQDPGPPNGGEFPRQQEGLYPYLDRGLLCMVAWWREASIIAVEWFRLRWERSFLIPITRVWKRHIPSGYVYAHTENGEALLPRIHNKNNIIGSPKAAVSDYEKIQVTLLCLDGASAGKENVIGMQPFPMKCQQKKKFITLNPDSESA